VVKVYTLASLTLYLLYIEGVGGGSRRSQTITGRVIDHAHVARSKKGARLTFLPTNPSDRKFRQDYVW